MLPCTAGLTTIMLGQSDCKTVTSDSCHEANLAGVDVLPYRIVDIMQSAEPVWRRGLGILDRVLCGGMLASNLILRLLVAVGDHAVEERAWLALIMTIGFSFLDLAVEVGRGLLVLTLVARVVLVEVLG
jgi:hypothetical protein